MQAVIPSKNLAISIPNCYAPPNSLSPSTAQVVDNRSHDSCLLTATDETFYFLDKKGHVLPRYTLYFNHRVGNARDRGDSGEADEQLSEAVGRPPRVVRTTCKDARQPEEDVSFPAIVPGAHISFI